MDPLLELNFQDERPSALEYQMIRTKAGWGEVSERVARAAIERSIISICIRRNSKLFGLGRVVGDGCLYFFISDVFVDPSLRGLGVGRKLVNDLTMRARNLAQPTSTIGVFAAPSSEALYESAGFTPCPNSTFGSGLVLLQ